MYMKRYYFIPLILSGAFAISSCSILTKITGKSTSNSAIEMFSSKDGEKIEKVDLIPDSQMMETTYFDIINDGVEIIDNEQTNRGFCYTINESGRLLYSYYPTTFYLKNTSEKIVRYEGTFSINSKDKDYSPLLASTVRAMLFINLADSDNHNYNVYAQAKTGTDEKELISVEGSGYAEKFDGDTVCNVRIANFEPGMNVRVTFVYWFEGNDPDSSGFAPTEGSIKFTYK